MPSSNPSSDPRIIHLWDQNATGRACPDTTLSVHLPDNPSDNMSAVIVFPGGGYAMVCDTYEGVDCAEWLRQFGVATFVLRYRVHPNSLHPAPLTDAQRAIRTVRSRASEWGIDPNRIGIWGFSAGGHLAATVGTHYDSGDPTSPYPIERVGSRPDFMVLAYPVISMDPALTHQGSMSNLLGESPSQELIDSLSADKQVTADTPPTFLFHTTEDATVPVENSVAFYTALVRSGVPAELHIFQSGPHGVGLGQDFPSLKSWPDLLLSWLRTRELL